MLLHSCQPILPGLLNALCNICFLRRILIIDSHITCRTYRCKQVSYNRRYVDDDTTFNGSYIYIYI